MSRKLGFGPRLKCRIVPTRRVKPTWTAKKVGQVACYAAQSGATQEELLEELAKCAPCKGKRRNQREQAQVAQAFAENDAILNDTQKIFVALDVGLGAILLLSRFVPMLRAATVPMTVVKRSAALLTTRIGSRLAANDEIFQLFAREAA